jgi:pimeloyl-ACP methyl ester carboxylesterase
MTVVYFHGMPGSPRELTICGGDFALSAWAPNRTRDRLELSWADYRKSLAAEIALRNPACGLRLVGFSLGCVAALEIAGLLGEKITSVDLVSPAAPLDLGDFLPDMAGRAIFELARDRPTLFAAVVRAQGALARFWPAQLHRLLFATARGEDLRLAREPEFRAMMKEILREAYNEGARGFRREVTSYVTQQTRALAAIKAPVELWHGADDNWSPASMTQSLNAALPRVSKMRILAGLSHYSTLQAALPEILRRRLP